MYWCCGKATRVTVVPLSAINKERTKKEPTILKYNDAIFVNDRDGCYKGVVIAIG